MLSSWENVSWYCSHLQMKSCHKFCNPNKQSEVISQWPMWSWLSTRSCKPTLGSHQYWSWGEWDRVDYDMGSFALQNVSCHLQLKQLIQNIINLGKCRNYFHFSGIISFFCLLPCPNFKHSNSNWWASCSSTAVHTLPFVITHKYV